MAMNLGARELVELERVPALREIRSRGEWGGDSWLFWAGAMVAAIDLAAHSSMISLEGMVAEFLPHLLGTAGDISARLDIRAKDEAL